MVVGPEPLRGKVLRLLDGFAEVVAQPVIARGAAAALDTGILLRLAGLDVLDANSVSGSDFSSFVHHPGIAAPNVSFGGAGESGGVYHSAYHTREQQAKALAAGACRLADDPTLSGGDPTPLKPVPFFSFAPLQNALTHRKASAAAYDAALAAHDASLPASARAELVSLAARNEQSLLQEPGLPGGRGWYRNRLYAPGRLTGHGAKTLPGLREAIEDERWGDVETCAALTERALRGYAAGLDEGLEVMGR